MTREALQVYIDELFSRLTVDRYVERRFTTVDQTGGIPVDMDLHFRGMMRDREPKLADVLKHPSVVILAEPGGGKSVIARAAARQLATDRERVPIFVELKEYRGALPALISAAAPTDLLDPFGEIAGKLISRAYVLDGIDEIPRGTLEGLGADVEELFRTDPNAAVVLTARQAFYATHRDSLPPVAAVFHILDFSDKDIAEYVKKSNVDVDGFLAAVRIADASEEIRNPFILSVMIEKYRDEGALSDRRSENLNFMVDRLIESRKRVNRHQQRRALRMLGIALETYSRNELTEEEALRVIKQSMRIADREASTLLDELYASILKRTANGLAFQMRSYGEYLAAEELESVALDRVKELAFLNYNSPNDSWLNAVSYLIELNPPVRAYFVRHHPLWAISSSPSTFSADEKAAIVRSALDHCTRERQFIFHHPLINAKRLSRFMTEESTNALLEDLEDSDDVIRGNAMVLLGMSENADVVTSTLEVVKDRTLGVDLRYCAVIALVNVGKPRHVPDLLAALDREDPLHTNYLDMLGAIIDESQINLVLPFIFHENAMLSAAYYHFRQFASRAALVAMLRYFLEHPNDLNTYRAESYVEPVIELLPHFFDSELASLCADLLETIERLRIYPDQSGPMPKLLALMQQADREGQISRMFLERLLGRGGEDRQRIYYVDQIVVSLMTPATAHWLVEQHAVALIREIAPYSHGDIREILRPHSGGVIQVQDSQAKAYRDEQTTREESRLRHITMLQDSFLAQTSLNDALKLLWELKEDYWPEIPEDFRDWLASEVSKSLQMLDLEKNIEWKGTSLWEPRVLPFLMKVIDRYQLRVAPDVPLAYATMAMDAGTIARYHKRFGLSESARKVIERLAINPPSTEALGEVVRFIEASELWSADIEESMKRMALSDADLGYFQTTVLNLLVKHGAENRLIEEIATHGAREEMRDRAFNILIERQDRRTIERALATLTDAELMEGNTRVPDMSALGWLGKIKSDFAWDKLVDLRARALRLELPMLVGVITEALARMDRAKTASVIRKQIAVAPGEWRIAQTAQAIEQERAARIEAAQRTPFESVLKKLKGSTSINRLKVLSEGTTDRPVLRSLIEQVGTAGNVIFDKVGGWGGLRAEPDPNVWLVGCKEAFIVLDGDEGRQLRKAGKPLTKLAKEERKRLVDLPISLRVLERYGIENYFPRQALEQVTGKDLSAYFPIPDHVPVIDRLSRNGSSLIFKLRKMVAKAFQLAQPSPKQPLYTKSRNGEIAHHLKLIDVQGTDLLKIVEEICETADRMAEE
jgi:hypothetical protein